jgi:hypothetical protein
MANALYTQYKQTLLGAGGINLSSDTIKVALATAAYVANMATDQFFSAVGSNFVGTPQQITSPSITGGVFNGNGVTYTAVTGSQATQLVIYKDTGSAATSPLICRDDTASSGLPVTPNGGNITITWDTGASKIFAL